jgi:hypothetical protein
MNGKGQETKRVNIIDLRPPAKLETSCQSLTMEFMVEEQKTTLTMEFTIKEQINHGIHDRVTENKLTMEFMIKEQIETRRSQVSGRPSVEEKGKVETS